MACAAYADEGSFDPGMVRQLPDFLANHSGRSAQRQGLGTSAGAYDTTWVGFSASNHVGPNNYWNIYAGVDRPGTVNPNNAVWDFENLTNAHGDSLMGWWPTNDRAGVLGSALTDDHDYAYSCLAFGNETNNVNLGVSANQRRTKGIIGAWHADPGILAPSGHAVTWSPIAGGKSAWCGLRVHGDMSVIDAQTLNPYNGDCIDFGVQTTGAGRTAKNFPGYVRAWDQMLYRDITPVTGQPLTLSFLYRTRMSTAYVLAAGRRGWYHGDPLSTTDGNFISSYSQNGPIDSFEVYIGVPANDDSVTLSTGAIAPVYDPQRRWFSEVLRIFDGADAPYYQLLGQTGIHPASPDTTGSVAFSQVIPWSDLDPLKPQISLIANSIYQKVLPGEVRSTDVRLVFRVHTNATSDDLTSGTWGELGGRGAAQIDNVTTQWGAATPTVIGAFEGNEGMADNVNNAIGTSPETYWKSTGKPPALYFHARPLTGLPWHDLCGSVTSGVRTCNMVGNVLDAGNDPSEMIGDNTYDGGLDGFYGILSPTINLSTTTNPNSMGLTPATAAGSLDYYLKWDVYSGDFIADITGVLYYCGAMSYPNMSTSTSNGVGTECWGDLATLNTVYYTSDVYCYGDLTAMKAHNMVYTTKVGGQPDSLRLWIGVYNFPLWWGGCTAVNPADGAYFDNVSLAIVNTASGGGVGSISSDIWQWFNDAFPVGGPALGGATSIAALDTCGALIKGAINNAQLAGTAGLGGVRLDILADSIKVTATDPAAVAGDTSSTKIRVDMVFRILPGPGNYRAVVGTDVLPKYPLLAGMHLLRRPDNRTTIVNPSDLSDSSFWAEYIRTPGDFSAGTHNGHTAWDNLTWNSARCDTLRTNYFPGGLGAVIGASYPVTAGVWQSTYHILDPHLAYLGVARPRCFVVDTTLVNSNSANTICGAAPAWLTTVPQSRTGWDGQLTTTLGTKIIPDGLLTPGSHVQYFFRKSTIFQHGGFVMCPDTATIMPQRNEDNYDAHRWQQFSILPDRWKDAQYGGLGAACMLYADYDDRQGDEMVWCSVMDSIGGTVSNKWGAHNGWHSAPHVVLDAPLNPTLQADAFVYQNAQPGTLWDMYACRATESGYSVGGRLGGRLVTHGADLLLGHDAQIAPTPDMLRQYYTAIALLTGSLATADIGPVLDSDIPEDDVSILTDFLETSTGLQPQPRGLFIAGDGFAESEAASTDPNHATFMSDVLGTSFVGASYAALSHNAAQCVDLVSTAVISATVVSGVSLSCVVTEDVLHYNAGLAGSQTASWYGPAASGYAAAIYHQRQTGNSLQNYVSLVDGFDLAGLWGRYCSSSYGRLEYTYNVMTKVFSQACTKWVAPTPIGDVPRGGQFANSLWIGNSVGQARNATINFGVAAPGRVRVRLYDVTGRVVRTLTDKTYDSGPQSIRWDGMDASGNQAARGVYFARIDYASGAAINGRVVVLR